MYIQGIKLECGKMKSLANQPNLNHKYCNLTLQYISLIGATLKVLHSNNTTKIPTLVTIRVETKKTLLFTINY